MVVDAGALRQAQIELGVAPAGTVGGCGWRVTSGLDIPLTGRAFETTWWMRIGYLPAAVERDRHRRRRSAPGPARVVWEPVRAEGTFDSVRIEGLDPGRPCASRSKSANPSPEQLYEQRGDTPPRLTPELSPVFPVLDTLRAVGALAVLTTHVAFQSGAYVRHGVWGALLSRLDVGVAIFFVLSGFLLSRPYLARAPDRRRTRGRALLLQALAAHLPGVRRDGVAGAGAGPREPRPRWADWVRTLTLTNIYTSRGCRRG